MCPSEIRLLVTEISGQQGLKSHNRGGGSKNVMMPLTMTCKESASHHFSTIFKNIMLREDSPCSFSAVCRPIFDFPTSIDAELSDLGGKIVQTVRRGANRIYFVKIHVNFLDFQPLIHPADVPSTVIKS